MLPKGRNSIEHTEQICRHQVGDPERQGNWNKKTCKHTFPSEATPTTIPTPPSPLLPRRLMPRLPAITLLPQIMHLLQMLLQLVLPIESPRLKPLITTRIDFMLVYQMHDYLTPIRLQSIAETACPAKIG